MSPSLLTLACMGMCLVWSMTSGHILPRKAPGIRIFGSTHQPWGLSFVCIRNSISRGFENMTRHWLWFSLVLGTVAMIWSVWILFASFMAFFMCHVWFYVMELHLILQLCLVNNANLFDIPSHMSNLVGKTFSYGKTPYSPSLPLDASYSLASASICPYLIAIYHGTLLLMVLFSISSLNGLRYCIIVSTTEMQTYERLELVLSSAGSQHAAVLLLVSRMPVCMSSQIWQSNFILLLHVMSLQ